MQICIPDARMCTWCEAKQNQNAGVWNREKFIAGPCKEMGHALKTPELPKRFQQSPFLGKTRKESG